MNSPVGSETPQKKISTAEAGLGLALRINAEVLAGRIDKSIYQREIRIVTGSSGLVLPPYPAATQEDLIDGIYNFIQLALSASALTTDETLDEVFGELAKETDNNRSNIRVMAKQLRNAFAHNPWRPKWQIYPKYRAVFPITLDDGSQFSFDATSLDGDGVKPEHVGGIEFWIKLLQHCARDVA